jgi:hypothetical protein
MTGTSPDNFQIELHDSSAKLLAPDTIAVVNNQIWCLCDQGITVVTETGVSVVSRPIEDLILDQFGLALDAVRYYSFGVGYETERQYILWTVSSSADTVPQQAFVFNLFTQAYTRWPIAKTTALVSPVDDKLYLGSGTTFDLEQERKSRNYTDFVDYGTSYTISSTSGTQVFMTSTSEIEVGDLLYQLGLRAVARHVSPGRIRRRPGQHHVGNRNGDRIQGHRVRAGVRGRDRRKPGDSKAVPGNINALQSRAIQLATLSFATDASAYYEDVTITGNRTGLWGLFPWGNAPWGSTATTLPIRTYVPLEKQRGSFLRVRFTHRQGYGYFKLLGFSLPIRDTESFVIAK